MTSKEVVAYIEERYGKRYHPDSIQRVLRRPWPGSHNSRKKTLQSKSEIWWALKGI